MKFPFTEDTLGKKLEAGTGLSVDCLTCKRKATLERCRTGEAARARPWRDALEPDQGPLLP
ncbi:MAG: hypothetical protein E5V88_26210 [Mesorhizobium sp.]|nr:MAG: hypothetical protein E5V88_26210 [Mesorhizobium sp.]